MSPNVAYWLELYDEDESDFGSNKVVTKKMTILSVDGVVPAKPQLVDPTSDEPTKPLPVEAEEVPDLLLMPASRVEIYIDRRGIDQNKNKNFVLRTKKLDAGSDKWPEIQLARITFKASAEMPVNVALNIALAERTDAPSLESVSLTPKSKPPGCMRDLQDGEYRRVTFQPHNPAPPSWEIQTEIMKNDVVQKKDNGKDDLRISMPFNDYVNKKKDHEVDWNIDHTCIRLRRGKDQKPQLWELWNISGDLHNFHIHQIKFRLANLKDLKEHGIKPPEISSMCQKKSSCKQPDYKRYENSSPQDPVSDLGRTESKNKKTITSITKWHDTILMPPLKKVYIMMSFADKVQVGRFVYHCHILKHEDNGLMAPIEVWDPEGPVEASQQ